MLVLSTPALVMFVIYLAKGDGHTATWIFLTGLSLPLSLTVVVYTCSLIVRLIKFSAKKFKGY